MTRWPHLSATAAATRAGWTAATTAGWAARAAGAGPSGRGRLGRCEAKVNWGGETREAERTMAVGLKNQNGPQREEGRKREEKEFC
jgi:hypothetical protein